MIENISLLINNPEIIKGLASGDLVRYGSVIRWAAGVGEHPGSIFKHLVETPGITSKLINSPIAPISTGVDVIGHTMTYHKLLGIDQRLVGMSQSLNQVLGLSQLAAGAGILNLGISIAGFAYMGYELHQMQKSINVLRQTVEKGFDTVNRRLDTMSQQLGYICLVVQDSRAKQEKLAQAIAHLYQSSLIREISELQAELQNLHRFPDESPIGAIKIASRIRLFLSHEALKITPELEAELMLNSDIAIQGRAVSTITEANLLMEIGRHQDAKEMLKEEVVKFRQLSENWSKAFLDDDNNTLSTSYRFVGKPFNEFILPERVERICQIYPKDFNLTPDQVRRIKTEINVEFDMSYASERYNQAWINKQLAIAEYLDTLSELLARLDTLQNFAQLCQDRGVKSSRELLPGNDAEPGLYLLPG
jgi:tetratricopeptide (TPR) repeat protein